MNKVAIQRFLDQLSDEVQALPDESGVVVNYTFTDRATDIVEEFVKQARMPKGLSIEAIQAKSGLTTLVTQD